MKINGNEIRPGNLIEHKGGLYRVLKTQAVKPGKGGAYNQCEMKEIRVGTKLNERFRSSETVERIRLEQQDYQFLFAEGDMLTFMDLETYEQLQANIEAVNEAQRDFLQDGVMVTIETYEHEIIGITLPEHMTFMITEADAVVKGQTQSSSFKPAVLENGVRVLVPPHIDSGVRIVVNTLEGTYVERAKD